MASHCVPVRRNAFKLKVRNGYSVAHFPEVSLRGSPGDFLQRGSGAPQVIR